MQRRDRLTHYGSDERLGESCWGGLAAGTGIKCCVSSELLVRCEMLRVEMIFEAGRAPMVRELLTAETADDDALVNGSIWVSFEFKCSV